MALLYLYVFNNLCPNSSYYHCDLQNYYSIFYIATKYWVICEMTCIETQGVETFTVYMKMIQFYFALSIMSLIVSHAVPLPFCFVTTRCET